MWIESLNEWKAEAGVGVSLEHEDAIGCPMLIVEPLMSAGLAFVVMGRAAVETDGEPEKQ